MIATPRFSENLTAMPAVASMPVVAAIPQDAPMLQRATGAAHIAVESRAGGGHSVATLHQSGAAKIPCPRNHADDAFEAVLLNTAGGLAGGDRLCWEASAGEGVALRVTTQAAERVYRSLGGDATVATDLRAATGATLEWLPQETILFDRSRLSRTLSIDLAGDARLLALESVVFGRRAHGETVRSGSVRDHWRVRRDGRLIYADSVRIGGEVAALLDRPATLGGARAYATLVMAGPGQASIDELRAMLPTGDGLEAGASALPEVTVVRIVAAHGDVLRPALARMLLTLRGIPLPRTWQV